MASIQFRLRHLYPTRHSRPCSARLPGCLGEPKIVPRKSGGTARQRERECVCVREREVERAASESTVSLAFAAAAPNVRCVRAAAPNAPICSTMLARGHDTFLTCHTCAAKDKPRRKHEHEHMCGHVPVESLNHLGGRIVLPRGRTRPVVVRPHCRISSQSLSC